jgi:hypothetical protein
MIQDMMVGFEIEFLSFIETKTVKNELMKRLADFLPTPEDMVPTAPTWRFHRDSSIVLDKRNLAEMVANVAHDGEWHGIEISSPALKLTDALESMRIIFDYIDKGNSSRVCFTNSSCGLHINISLPGGENHHVMQNINRLKLLMLLNEDAILKQFKRQNNRYCRSYRSEILNPIIRLSRINLNNRIKEAIFRLNEIEDKYRTVNFGKLQTIMPYLEFRLMGGQNYHKRFSEVEKNVVIFCKIIEECTKPISRYVGPGFNTVDEIRNLVNNHNRIHQRIGRVYKKIKNKVSNFFGIELDSEI